MRVVIDTNALQSDGLRLLLSADPNNVAVLAEHTVSEIFKPSKLEAVYASFEVLADHPKQIVLLKANRYNADVDTRYPGMANRFVDQAATKGMPAFVDAIHQARGGHAGYQSQLIERRGWALERIDRAEKAFGDMSDQLETVREIFKATDLAKLAKREPTSTEFKFKILDFTTALSTDMWLRRTGRTPPRQSEWYNDFTWRYALCHILQMLRLAAAGGTRRKSAKAVNDHLDNVFATYGTYYNGLMTNDAEAFETHTVARIILEQLGARIPTDFIESGYLIDQLDRVSSDENE